MAIQKKERALLVVSYIAQVNQLDVYSFVQVAGNIISQVLGSTYSSVTILENKKATKSGFVKNLKSLADQAAIKEIDVIMMTHGGDKKIYFYGGGVNSEDLGGEIKDLNIKSKLRFYYTTACYGSSHCPGMIKAGFNSAVGAKGVNTNGATEFPILTAGWAGGSNVASCVSAGMVGYQISDAIAQFQYANANSFKVIHGSRQTTINLNAA